MIIFGLQITPSFVFGNVFDQELVVDEDYASGALVFEREGDHSFLPARCRWLGGKRGIFTIPNAIVFARALGCLFVKRRGTEKPIVMWMRKSWIRWIISFWRWEGMKGICMLLYGRGWLVDLA